MLLRAISSWKYWIRHAALFRVIFRFFFLGLGVHYMGGLRPAMESTKTVCTVVAMRRVCSKRRRYGSCGDGVLTRRSDVYATHITQRYVTARWAMNHGWCSLCVPYGVDHAGVPVKEGLDLGDGVTQSITVYGQHERRSVVLFRCCEFDVPLASSFSI